MSKHKALVPALHFALLTVEDGKCNNVEIHVYVLLFDSNTDNT